MIMDSNQTMLVDQVTVFPDYVFGGLPRPEPLTEIDVISGNDTNTINIGGNITAE